MVTSNLNVGSQVYVSAEDGGFPHQSHPFPLLRIIINVERVYQCKTDITNTFINHNPRHELKEQLKK